MSVKHTVFKESCKELKIHKYNHIYITEKYRPEPGIEPQPLV